MKTIFITLALTLTACLQINGKPDVSELKLTSKLLAGIEDTNSNYVISPLGLKIVLESLLLGTKENGCKTRFMNMLRIKNTGFTRTKNLLDKAMVTRGTLYDVSIHNTVFYQKGIKLSDSYKKMGTELLRTKFECVNFKNVDGAVAKMNDIISHATQNLYPKAIDSNSIDGNTKAVIANAIYFRAEWNNQFFDSEIKDFILEDGTKIRAEMLIMESNVLYTKSERLGATIMAKKYTHDTYFVIVLPDDTKNFKDFEKKNLRSNQALVEAIATAKSEFTCITFPAITLNETINLDQILEEKNLDCIKKHAIDGNEDVPISKIQHSVIFRTDQQGATGEANALHLNSFGGGEMKFFTANRPFLFYVINLENGAIFFQGRIKNPRNN